MFYTRGKMDSGGVYKIPFWGSFKDNRLISASASRTLQGKEVRASLDKTFAKLMSDLDGGFTPVNFVFPRIPTPANHRRDKAQKAFSDFYVGIIKKRKENGVVRLVSLSILCDPGF